MKNSALGLIETYGYVGAVEAADAALKAANVTLVDLVMVGAGIMTLTMTGDVSAVKASVDAGAASAERVGILLSSHVIARLDEEVWSMVKPSNEEPFKDPDPMDEKSEDDGSKEEPEEKKDDVINKKMAILKKEVQAIDTEEPTPEPGDTQPTIMEKSILKVERFSKDMLEKLKVMELRSIARTFEDIKIPKNQIKYANKATLILEISQAQERRSEA